MSTQCFCRRLIFPDHGINRIVRGHKVEDLRDVQLKPLCHKVPKQRYSRLESFGCNLAVSG
jgi:hypothetical protein